MESKPGIIGAAITIGAGLMGWMVKHEAEIRVTSFAISVVVGLLTIAWWIRKFWKAFTETANKLED